MAKWTKNLSEIKQLVKSREALYKSKINGSIINIELINGQKYEGSIVSQNFGNNGDSNSPISAYHGELLLRTKTGEDEVIDYLDVKDINENF